MPGLLDLQCNGGFGIDLTTEAHRVWELAGLLPRVGVGAFLPTLVSCPAATVDAALALEPPPGVRGREATGSDVLGWHLEGPFLSPGRRGAHPAHHVRPIDLVDLDRWLGTGGVAAVTLAPELDGALEAIERVVAARAVASIGHTDATARQVRAAVDAGARMATHLGNAMGAEARAAILAEERVLVGVIVDGEHVAPVEVADLWAALGPERFVLVSDAMAGLGLPPGRHRLGDGWVTTDGRRAVGDDARLAGSTLAMDDAVRNLVAFTGCSIDDAVAAASTTPARLLDC